VAGAKRAVPQTAPLPDSLRAPGQAYESALLRWATRADVAALKRLWENAYPGDADELLAWLAHGGALLLQDPDGDLLAALPWREEGKGWRIDRVATRADVRGFGYGRWLITKVEALAIKQNIPWLKLTLPGDDPEQGDYYQRLGYAADPDATPGAPGIHLHKVIGGVWQRQAR
jgi:GNAT superfamily N-acetyltransferase